MDNRIWVQIMCPSCACMFDSVVSVADYAKRIAELEAQIANAQKLADVLLDERNEEVKKVAYWSKAYDDAKRGAWNAAIEAAFDVCERMRERFVILEQDEKSSYEARHDNGTIAVSLMQATNAIKSLLK